MKLKSNFSNGLDFKPQISWPDTLPAIALGGSLLTGFQLGADHPVFEHEFKNFEESALLLKSLYPQLTLAELARLIKSAEFSKYFQAEPLLKAFGFHSSPDVLEILNALSDLPAEFQRFISVKKVGLQELVPLLDLSLEERQFLCLEVIKAADSKQDAVKRIELLSDLLQMKKSPEFLKDQSLIDLQKIRYPVTSQRDEALAESKLPWLSQIKSQFKRRGDKAGFEVQFFAGTPAELSKLAQNLTRVAQEWNSKS